MAPRRLIAGDESRRTERSVRSAASAGTGMSLRAAETGRDARPTPKNGSDLTVGRYRSPTGRWVDGVQDVCRRVVGRSQDVCRSAQDANEEEIREKALRCADFGSIARSVDPSPWGRLTTGRNRAAKCQTGGAKDGCGCELTANFQQSFRPPASRRANNFAMYDLARTSLCQSRAWLPREESRIRFSGKDRDSPRAAATRARMTSKAALVWRKIKRCREALKAAALHHSIGAGARWAGALAAFGDVAGLEDAAGEVSLEGGSASVSASEERARSPIAGIFEVEGAGEPTVPRTMPSR
jgi:hypothetical protein